MEDFVHSRDCTNGLRRLIWWLFGRTEELKGEEDKMKSVKIEVSEFELSLLLGLVDEQRIEYREKAVHNTADQDSASLAMSFDGLHVKLRAAKPIKPE